MSFPRTEAQNGNVFEGPAEQVEQSKAAPVSELMEALEKSIEDRQDAERTDTKRVSITLTRLRAIQTSLNAAVVNITNAKMRMETLVVGRQDNTSTNTALFNALGHAREGHISASLSQINALVTEFEERNS